MGATPTRSPKRPPVVRSITAVPDKVDPLACTPPDPPERPVVIAKVDSPDIGLGSVTVRLMYGVGGTSSYHGDVLMKYDASRKAFV